MNHTAGETWYEANQAYLVAALAAVVETALAVQRNALLREDLPTYQDVNG